MSVYPGIAPQTYPITIREWDAGHIEPGELRISTALSGHTPTSLCYRFDSAEGSVAYTGDCAASAVYENDGTLANFCRGVDVLISECSFPAGWPPGDHLNGDSAGQLAARAGAGRLVLTHLYPPAAAQTDLAAQVGIHYSGTIDVATDGFSLTLPARDG
jgi:ribonuclease BN (tRNA processing enzyme)